MSHEKFFTERRLKPEFETYLRRGESTTFANLCGDHFVSQETYGRELFGVIEIQQYTNASYDKVQLALGGYYKAFQAAAQFSTAV
ncbi:MAG: hypothetical protein EHM23_33750, partial [Acidobacteria bacterium]